MGLVVGLHVTETLEIVGPTVGLLLWGVGCMVGGIVVGPTVSPSTNFVGGGAYVGYVGGLVGV